MILFIEYPPCSTCKNAKKWLLSHDIAFNSRHIVKETPSFEELKKWITLSNQDIKSFFNTSGNVYKSLNLKEKLLELSFDEKVALLASNGMLIKRPILIDGQNVMVGFKESKYSEHFKKA